MEQQTVKMTAEELAEFEEELMLLSSGSLEWEEQLLAESDEALKSMPVSELSGLNDELYEMELMFKDL